MSATLAPRGTAIRPSPLLRAALFADAAACGGMGLLLLGGGAALAGALGLPTGLLQAVGLLLLPAGALMAWLARRETLPVWLVWTVIGAGAVWVVDSVLLLASGWVAPTPLGTAFILAQALAVAALATAEWAGLRRSRT